MSASNKKMPVIGMIGGGQLGRMFLQNAANYGAKVVVLEKEYDAPAVQLTHNYVQGSIKDPQAIRKLAELCDVMTYEIEHIHTDVLLELKAEGHTIIPDPAILKIIQDKGLQKRFYADNNIPTAPFQLVNHPSEWLKAMLELGGGRFAAKARTGGYDGKGVFLTDSQWISENGESIPFSGPTVIEQFIPCKKEIAVLVAVGQDGQAVVYPAVDMAFHPVSNLVTYLFTPAEIDEAIERKAEALALKTIQALGGAGLFAVEMFLTEDDDLLINEIAPRPHNSAHHTIEGSYTSQFDQLLRVLMGWPLGVTAFHQAAVMINLVGPEGGEGEYYLKNIEKATSLEGVYVHLYGKKTSKPHRKLGHITITAPTLKVAKEKAEQVQTWVSVALHSWKQD